jgi:hypothetical protein
LPEYKNKERTDNDQDFSLGKKGPGGSNVERKKDERRGQQQQNVFYIYRLLQIL